MKRLLPTILLLALAACGARETTAAERAQPTATAVAATATFTPTPSATPAPTATPTATPTQGIAGYLAYRVQPGDSPESIARAGGSDPELLLRYNRLEATPQVGRELLIPRIEGRARSIPERSMMVLRGNTAKPWVALTLDCGNSYGHLGAILDELRAEKVHLTFFLVGSLIEDSPVELRRLVDEGHELASHSYSHPDFTALSDAAILEELDRNEASIQAILGPQASLRPYFRFPYGAFDTRSLQVVLNHGYLPAHWTLDTLDSLGEPKTPEFIVERVMALPPEQLRGAIILGHCTNAITGAIPELVRRLGAAGYQLRTLSDVLGE
ncbi:polysaccharide deacetylase family protein [Oscillochloris sp. ZM17-4]|uniref:polysaccharide deacetylase family protein n=1 Tax=Oscillochloris sp. ZM17-4 TaxID=2866714 RepID=UPI001C72B93D|nr:polysaccharide deacetylase family protein [Oscillochloris sp. ZM17-4]MBX0326214.1 polysaccharide deacetylase family protein [Oscillochloris sp. ZM17-4]